jgi:ATP-dependent Clp protease ATP-binding subunit ClpC
VVLFDEVEKAHPDVFNILLQILEDGRLTDGHGRTIDFKNTVLIMTSNLGTQELQRPVVGFRREEGERDEQKRLSSAIESALKQTFRPEFLNRIDEVIIFHPLTEEHIRKIADLLKKDLERRLADRKIALELTEGAKSWLAKEGYDPTYGARPLRRAIQRYIENPLSKRLLQGDFGEGDTVVVDLKDGELIFSKSADALKVS